MCKAALRYALGRSTVYFSHLDYFCRSPCKFCCCLHSIIRDKNFGENARQSLLHSTDKRERIIYSKFIDHWIRFLYFCKFIHSSYARRWKVVNGRRPRYYDSDGIDSRTGSSHFDCADGNRWGIPRIRLTRYFSAQCARLKKFEAFLLSAIRLRDLGEFL